jgi:hypothetical protein
MGILLRRLEAYTEGAMTEAMKDIIVRLMVEVLGNFAIVTKEMKQGRASESIPANTLPVADKNSEKCFKKLVGRRDHDDVKDALSRLDQVTHEFWMAATRVLRIRVDHRAWLSPPDPSTNQNIACSAQHEGTETWFLQGSIFMEWRSKSTTSLLWIHGKRAPLCSFTSSQILITSNHCSGFREEHPMVCYYLSASPSRIITQPTSSAIIQEIMALQEAGLASMAYFYFDFRDTDKRNLYNLLPSLLIQLSARSESCCDILSVIYDEGVRKPSTNTLIACLKEMLALPGQGPIYVILDALNECPNTSGIPSARKQVLDLLKDLVGLQLSDLHICVTSRPEVDIRAALDPLAFHSVSIHEQTGQKNDIENYIRYVVYADSDTVMKSWRDNDKELVIETLTEWAHGM